MATKQSTLTFVSQQTIAQFKQEKQIERLPIKRNPETGKMFLAWVGGTGAVSKKYDSEQPKVISLVRDEDGAEFYLLHNEGVGAEIVEEL